MSPHPASMLFTSESSIYSFDVSTCTAWCAYRD